MEPLATANERKDKQDAENMVTAWRVLLLALTLMAVIFAGVAMTSSAGAGGAAGGCPLLPPPEQLPGHGVAAAAGEACQYRDNMTWPLCVNAALPGHHGELRCVRGTCAAALPNGEACADGRDEWCGSGLCAGGGGEWRCAAARSLGAGEPCRGGEHCAPGLRCAAGACAARVAAGGACGAEDTPSALTSPAAASGECADGSMCQWQGGALRCVRTAWGEAGTPCPYADGEEPPACLQGRLYCNERRVCAPLLSAGAPCAAAANGSAAAADRQCAYGLGCDAAVAACAPLYSGGEGQRASDARFCRPGLIIDAGYCAPPRGSGHVCGNSTECAAGLQCTCTGAAGGGTAPGRCVPPPLTLPASSDPLPTGLPAECNKEHAALARLAAQWHKRYSGDAAGYAAVKEVLQRQALCCMKASATKGSHAWILAAGYLIDLEAAEITCNTDMTWLYIMLTVTGFVTCFGCCAVCCSLLTPKDPAAVDANLPYGEAISPQPLADAEELKLHASLHASLVDVDGGGAAGPKCSSPLPPDRAELSGALPLGASQSVLSVRYASDRV